MLVDKKILLIVTGGIAACKTPELVRRLRKAGASVRTVLTKGGSEFVTPMTLGALSGDHVYQDLFSLTDESDMGHIQLSRDADLIVVAPATANIMAKMANGLADDLASTTLMATDKDVLIVPAMNVRMWEHPATVANVLTLQERGIHFVGPESGDMACGEFGMGRMAEPEDIVSAIENHFRATGILAGRHALVTSGPTQEPIDPVRYIANRSSGKQGHAIAAALSALGARTTLVSGPTMLTDPKGVNVIRVETARDMLDACVNALPADIAVCAAAVADWRTESTATGKIKKSAGAKPPALEMTENPDILKTLGHSENQRPSLLIGFAAETDDIIANATKKRDTKNCDWVLANDVSAGTGTFGGDNNTIHLVDANGVQDWPTLSKQQVATRLAQRVADHFKTATLS